MKVYKIMETKNGKRFTQYNEQITIQFPEFFDVKELVDVKFVNALTEVADKLIAELTSHSNNGQETILTVALENVKINYAALKRLIEER